MSDTIYNHPLLSAPIGKTMFKLATPNSVAMILTMMTSAAEAYFVGLHGVIPLAGLALVFPRVMMMNMLSAGAVGGAIAGLMARYAGSGDVKGAEAIAFHAILVAVALSIFFAAIFLLAGTHIFSFLGARNEVLAQALSYSEIFFTGVLVIWLANTLGSILRGLGEMKATAAWTIFAAFVQVTTAAILISGLGPFEPMGIQGAAYAALIGVSFSTLGQAAHLMRRDRKIRLRLSGIAIDWFYFKSILSIGSTASIGSLCMIGTSIAVSAFAARLGPEALAGYGIGARLEFIMIPVVFGIGAACINMIGVHFGAGQIDRAHRIGWTGAISAAILTGGIGLFFSIFPEVLSNAFTDNQGARDAAELYLKIVAPFYGFFGLGLCLYFAAQGTGRVAWAAFGNVARFVFVLAGGWLLYRYDNVSTQNLYWLVAVGMVIYGTIITTSVWLGAWRRGLPSEALNDKLEGS
jgi:putative MATE family efflux protein